MSELIRIYAPESPISCIDPIDCNDLISILAKSDTKSIAYFDEEVEIFIILPLGSKVKGSLSIEIQYDSDKSISNDQRRTNNNNNKRSISYSINENPNFFNDNYQIWKFKFSIIPGRNYTNINIITKFEKELTKIDNLLKPFEEVNLIQVAGVDLLNDKCIENNNDIEKHSNNIQDENLLINSIKMNISSLYKMSLKSFKTEKTLAWLDLNASKSIEHSNTSLKINSISIDCINCDISSCTPIKFPINLNKKSQLTIAYHISYDDESTLKPLSVIIDAIIDNHKHIITKWISKLDLSSHGTPLNYSTSNLGLNNKRIQQQPTLLPPVKLAKLRSYNSLLNQNIPKIQQPRLISNNSLSSNNLSSVSLNRNNINNNNSNNNNLSTNNNNNNNNNSNNNNNNPIINGNSGLGGKRYASVKLKSGSNLSLSQLWTGNSSQNFQRGLVITVSGPTKVKLGEKFKWKIQLLNKSSEKMDLILYVQSSIKKEYEKTIPPIPIQSNNIIKNDIVPLFTNNQLVRSFYYKFNRAGLVSLTNNLRVSLEYGNLYECELELISVEKGMFNIYDFKVLDIASGDIFECNRLLDVMVI